MRKTVCNSKLENPSRSRGRLELTPVKEENVGQSGGDPPLFVPLEVNGKSLHSKKSLFLFWVPIFVRIPNYSLCFPIFFLY